MSVEQDQTRPALDQRTEEALQRLSTVVWNVLVRLDTLERTRERELDEAYAFDRGPETTT